MTNKDWEKLEPRLGNVDFTAQFFTYEHLPKELAEISSPFCNLAKHVIAVLPSNPEKSVTLRKLLEAKDAAVRAYLAK